MKTIVAHRGKIGRLPADVRDELCRHLNNGAQGPELLAWLNALPEVAAIIAQDFDGKPINAQNLSDWRHKGFPQWLERNDRRARIKHLAEYATELAAANGGSIAKGAAAIVSGQILEVLEAADEKGLEAEAVGELVRSIAALRGAEIGEEKLAHEREKIRQKDEELKLAREKFQLEAAGIALKILADQRARDIAAGSASNADKISQLGQLMFGDDWKPAAAV